MHQFFGNGGTVAVIVRVAKAGTGEDACVTLHSTEGHSECPVLEVHAKEPGVWGSGLRVAVDHDTPAPDETFNLQILDAQRRGPRVLHRALDGRRPRPLRARRSSTRVPRLVRVEGRWTRAGPTRPARSPSPSRRELPDLTVELKVKIGDVEREFTLYDPDRDGEPPSNVTELALLLERKLRALPDAPGKHAFAGAEVTAFGRRLQVVAGSVDPDDVVRFVGECANDLGLEASVNPPVFPLEGGKDGDPPGPRDLIGSEARKTGVQALRDVDDVNLLALPELSAYESTEDMVTVLSAAEQLCQERRIFLLVDSPVDLGQRGRRAGRDRRLRRPYAAITRGCTSRICSSPTR